ncbi:MAG: hypothetical protein HFE78_04725 [Clostridiales bacterium]|nr:hypothetical protein [Clostridiales bacterium]
MKKIIGRISLEDADKAVSLQCNMQSLITLSRINSCEIDLSHINNDLKRVSIDLSQHWDHIFNKYNIPNYVDKKIGVEFNTGYVYYEE